MQKLSKSSVNTGFTLIEIIVVVAIMLIIASFILVSIKNFRENRVYKNTVQDVVSLLEEARGLTLASHEGGVFGVRFEAQQMIRFRGPSFNAGDTANKVVVLDPLLTFSSITFVPSGSNVVFEKLTGDASPYGTTTLQLVSTPTETTDIIISKSGIVEVR